MIFHSYRLEEQYEAQLREMKRYSNCTEEKCEQLKAAYESSQRMHILKSAYSLVSCSCFKDKHNEIAIRFRNDYERDKEKVKECILSAASDCLKILTIALCTRRYIDIDTISGYIDGLKHHLEYWMRMYNFGFNIDVCTRLIDIERYLCIHMRIQNKEKEIYELLSKFGKRDEIVEYKQRISELFKDYEEDITNSKVDNAYYEEHSHLLYNIRETIWFGSWNEYITRKNEINDRI